jgi:transcriptional regulator
MYTPSPFAFPADRPDAAQAVMRENPFAAMVVTGPEGLDAVHIPFLFDPTQGDYGTLRAHVARANPIWRLFDGAPALVIFWGPHAYVSPDWYQTEGLVPTWNYVAVHAYGVPRIVEDPERVAAMMADLTAASEQSLAPKPPWTLKKVPEKQRTALMRGIVAFEIPITRIDAKQKLSQNRSAADVAGVAAGLRTTGGVYDATFAELMEKTER